MGQDIEYYRNRNNNIIVLYYTMQIIGVVCTDLNYGIGNKNEIPWNDTPEGIEDLKHFAKTTKEGRKPAVIMGYNTFMSIGKPLKGRINIVITSRTINGAINLVDDAEYDIVGHDIIDNDIINRNNTLFTHNDIGEALYEINKLGVSHLYVIGGKMIYYWFAQRRLYYKFYHSLINSEYECDIFIGETIKVLGDRMAIVDELVPEKGYIVKYYNIGYESNIKSLMHKILREPLEDNRTQFKSHSVMNQHLTFDLSNNVLPASTLRRQWIKGIFWELMWFIKGRTDLEFLHQHGVHIWDANAAAHNGNIGKIYGYQWRNFNGTGFDQIVYIIDALKNNPQSRRIMLSGWAPPQIFDDACLPPCHVSYTFNVKNGELYCQILQRSSDVALALSWNVISGAILTHLLAKVCGLKAKSLSITLCNAHIYENHIAGVTQMLDRVPRPYPRIVIRETKDIADYTWEDILILNYDPHDKIDMGEMAV